MDKPKCGSMRTMLITTHPTLFPTSKEPKKFTHLIQRTRMLFTGQLTKQPWLTTLSTLLEIIANTDSGENHLEEKLGDLASNKPEIWSKILSQETGFSCLTELIFTAIKSEDTKLKWQQQTLINHQWLQQQLTSHQCWTKHHHHNLLSIKQLQLFKTETPMDSNSTICQWTSLTAQMSLLQE